MRYYLGVHRFAPIAGMQGDFGWVRPRYRRFKCMLRFWNRLMGMGDDRLTKHVFIYDYQLCSGNWSNDVKQLSDLVNMTNVFDNKNNFLKCSSDK